MHLGDALTAARPPQAARARRSTVSSWWRPRSPTGPTTRPCARSAIAAKIRAGPISTRCFPAVIEQHGIELTRLMVASYAVSDAPCRDAMREILDTDERFVHPRGRRRRRRAGRQRAARASGSSPGRRARRATTTPSGPGCSSSARPRRPNAAPPPRTSAPRRPPPRPPAAKPSTPAKRSPPIANRRDDHAYAAQSRRFGGCGLVARAGVGRMKHVLFP